MSDIDKGSLGHKTQSKQRKQSAQKTSIPERRKVREGGRVRKQVTEFQKGGEGGVVVSKTQERERDRVIA